MRNSISLLLATLLAGLTASCGQPEPETPPNPTAREIVVKCAEAMGGPSGFSAVKSLRFLLKPGDPARNIIWEIERPNKVRKERPETLVLVFDGNRAGFIKGPPNEDGSFPGPHLVPEDDWHHFEMDIALYVPAFFEYPAEFIGTEAVGDTNAHLLQVTLPMGARVIYAIDANTYLPVKISLPSWDYHVFLGDYAETDGITYFHSFWTNPDRTGATTLSDLEFNVDLGEERFAFPGGIAQ